MEAFIYLIVLIALSYGIFKWAESKGRNAWAWCAVSLFISPLIVGLILLFVPKTLEKQAEDAKRLKELMAE